MTRKVLFSVFLMSCVVQLFAQNITVISAAGETPNAFVNRALAGKGVYLYNAKFSNSSSPISTNQIGVFRSNGFPDFQMDSGIVMTTGEIYVAPGPNTSYGESQAVDGFYSDPQMELLATNTVNGCATLDFDFVGLTDHISFMYTFASEEYPEYVCSNFNDVFAFFITGPDPETLEERTWNVAIIPGTVTDSTPNGIAVAINSVNPGTPGSSGGSGSGCYYDYASYYIANTSDTAGVQYDGYTAKLMAEATIVPCAEYHMHLSVCNVGDNAYDSGVFLEYGSFTSPSTQLGFEQDVRDTVRIGCPTTVPFDINETAYDDGWVHVTYGGNAVYGVDFQVVSDSGVVMDGTRSFYIAKNQLHYLEIAGLPTANLSTTKFIELYLETSVCPEYPALKVYDTMHFVMTANARLTVHDTNIVADYLCTHVGVTVESGTEPFTYRWIPADNLDNPYASETDAFITENSVYKVIVTDRYGCSTDTATVNITINHPVVGIDNAGVEEVKIYPNPASGLLNIDTEGLKEVEMYSVKGQKVFATQCSGNHVAINTEGMAAGMYYLRISTTNGIVTQTVVVK